MVELQSLSSPDAFILHCNKLAMERLHCDQPAEALALLQRAEEQLTALPETPAARKLKAITLNNIGCYYKRAAQTERALGYLEAALEIDATSATDYTNLAGTHLNLCAIKSQGGQHKAALSHALTALRLLKQCTSEPSPSLITTMVVAYHSAGLEYEHLGQLQNSVDSYNDGVAVSREKLGAEHPLTTSLMRSYYGAVDALDHSVFEAKRKRCKYVSVTPIPAKSEGFQSARKKHPRRALSKGAEKRGKQVSTPSFHRDGGLGEDEDARWLERRTITNGEYRNHSKSKFHRRKVTSGVQLQPLEYVTKDVRREKSFSAPDYQHIDTSQISYQRPAKAASLRKTSTSPQKPMQTLSEKLIKIEEKHTPSKVLEVVNIVSDTVETVYKGGIVEGMKVYQARKACSALRRGKGKVTVEKQARAAIAALEMLKREAAAETKISLPVGPKPPERVTQVRKLQFTKQPRTRPLDVIPEVESKSDLLLPHVVRIQAWYRMVQTRRLYLSITAAIRFIQVWWRLVRERRRR